MELECINLQEVRDLASSKHLAEFDIEVPPRSMDKERKAKGRYSVRSHPDPMANLGLVGPHPLASYSHDCYAHALIR